MNTLQSRINTTVSILSIPFFLGVWEIVSRSGIVNMVLFPPPSVVAVALVDWINSGQFIIDLAYSTYRVVIRLYRRRHIRHRLWRLNQAIPAVLEFLFAVVSFAAADPADRFRADRNPVVRPVGRRQILSGVLGRVFHRMAIGASRRPESRQRTHSRCDGARHAATQAAARSNLSRRAALHHRRSAHPRSAFRFIRWSRPNSPAPSPASSIASTSPNKIFKLAK